jgi:hypothetical protein
MTSSVATANRGRLAPGIDSAAPRPPYRFEVDVPEAWLVLDLNPRTSVRWVRRLVGQRAAGGRGSAADQLAAGRVLHGLISALRGQGVLLAAILARRTGKEVVAASLTMSWRQVRSVPHLDVLGAALACGAPGVDELVEHRHVDVVDLASGPALRLRGHQRARVPGSPSEREVTLHQLFVPTAQPGWVAVVTATTAVPRLSETVGETALRVAGSIRAGDAMR